MRKVLSLWICLCLVVCFCTISVLASDGSNGGEVDYFNLTIVIVVPLVIALVVCLLFKGQMKTARPQELADEYMELDESNLTVKQDIFTHSTRVVRKIPQNDNRK